jgi:hypothetical protein
MVKAEAPSLPKHRLAATLLLSRTNGRLRRPTHCAYPATNLKTRGPTPQGVAGKYVVCGRRSKEIGSSRPISGTMDSDVVAGAQVLAFSTASALIIANGPY